jgi:dTDP-D-glucose 4,6-dehydratase
VALPHRAHRDSYVDVSKAQKLLGYAPRLSNEQALCETYDWYLANRGPRRGRGRRTGSRGTRALGVLKRLN